MANVENLEQRILETVGNEDAFAIALTGEWGVGKTHLWDELRDKNEEVFSGKKYAYVSLFGLDSLASLKSAIAIEVHKSVGVNDSIWKKDILKPIKKFLSSLTGSNIGTTSDVRIGLNLGNNLITSIVFSHLKNTLVCLDDIERKSNGLPMSEIMGLVNYLKNERKCQVLMIMHDEESDDKEYFDKHKEKVFDEVLILDESLSIIKDKISDIETFPIYEKFYQTMGVRNLRFYQRVQRIYQEIIKHSSSLSNLSKEEILRQILIIKLVNDIPKVLYVDMKELEMYFSEDGLDDRLDIFLKSDDDALKATVRTKKEFVEEKLSKFYPNFRMHGWSIVVIELITNIDIDSEKFERLLNQDLINEEALESDREKKGLMAEYRNLNSDQSFNQRLFDNVKDRIDREAFPNLSFYYNILEKNDSPDLAKKFEELVKQYIEERIRKGPEEWLIGDYYLRTPVNPDIFYDFLVQTISNQKKVLALNADASAMSAVFMRFCKRGNVSKNFFEAIQNINKEKFSSIFWQPLDGIDRIRYIRELLEHPAFNIDIAKFNNGDRIDAAFWHYKKLIDTPKRPSPYQPFIVEKKLNEVKRWTLELLQERVSEKPNSSAAVEHLLELTNNLENI
ncbi:P-loop NTPase fold protein [Psychrobacter sp. SWN149]|uniref:P-loop NTPase fold protein n=1 Tax=Psychrobacter sp. SWN149 TaxID=2792057 RepID=UPI0018CEBB18|nr:P-loop NTPase fold protein [Psychrobacter sp. SWN149]MBH0006279.1 hypothetical protein [Psychrobacter sp. SWN149]